MIRLIIRRLHFLLLILCVSCASVRDTHLLRKTNAIYSSAVARFDRKCVNITAPKAPPECPGEEADLNATRKELLGYMQAFLLGPLPPSARARLEQIQASYEPAKK